MSRITPADPQSLHVTEQEAIARAERLMGFLSNDTLIMARNPELMQAFATLVGAVYAPGKVDAGLKRLIGLVTSTAAGCQYCMGHTAFASQRHGIESEKLEAVWDFEHSELFSDAEKAVLRVALCAGQTPNGVSDSMFAEFAEHFDEGGQVEIVAVIAMFGFLNRWNSTIATDLESLPAAALEAARRHTD